MKPPQFHVLTPRELVLVVMVSALMGGCSVALAALAFLSPNGCAIEADEPMPVHPVMTTHRRPA